MVVHVEGELLALAATCQLTHVRTSGLLRLDCWVTDQPAEDALVDTYSALLAPNEVLEAEANEVLQQVGVDLQGLLLDSDSDRDVVTRSDCAELAAAAAHVSIDDWPVECLHMPNIPKASRRKSDSGIDLMSLRLLRDAEGPLTNEEAVLLSSVKSRKDSGSQSVQAALASVSEMLDRPYLAQQLRVFHGHLRQRGVAGNLARIFHVLAETGHSNIRIHAVAVTSAGQHDRADEESEQAEGVEREMKLRGIFINQFADFHQRCP